MQFSFSQQTSAQRGPSNLDQWLTATLQRLLGASLSATALQALAQDLPDAVDRTCRGFRRLGQSGEKVERWVLNMVRHKPITPIVNRQNFPIIYVGA